MIGPIVNTVTAARTEGSGRRSTSSSNVSISILTAVISCSMRRKINCSTYLSRLFVNSIAWNHSFQWCTDAHSTTTAITGADRGMTILIKTSKKLAPSISAASSYDLSRVCQYFRRITMEKPLAITGRMRDSLESISPNFRITR